MRENINLEVPRNMIRRRDHRIALSIFIRPCESHEDTKRNKGIQRQKVDQLSRVRFCQGFGSGLWVGLSLPGRVSHEPAMALIKSGVKGSGLTDRQ